MVDRREFELGPHPHVRVEKVRADLQIVGRADERLVVQCSPEAGLRVEQRDHVIVLRSKQSLRLKVPEGATLEIGHVGGDLQVDGVNGEIHLGKVGGDASLHNCGRLVADRIGGDVLARQLSAAAAFKAVGGDVLLQGVDAAVVVLGAGGDASLRGLAGPVEAAVGGDVHLVVADHLAGDVDLQAGGEVYCRLPAAASAQVELASGGKLRVDGPTALEREWGQGSFVLGDGQHRVRVNAGGDLWLGVGEQAEADLDLESLGSEIAAKVGEKIAEMEAALSAMGAEVGAVSGERIAVRVQRIVDRAVGRSEHPGPPRGLQEALDGISARPGGDPVTDEERLRILQLLEQKKISVEEAEQLLEALEG